MRPLLGEIQDDSLGEGHDRHPLLVTKFPGGQPGTHLEIEEQDLRHRWFPRRDVEDVIRRSTITDNSTVSTYTLYLLDTVGAS